MTIKSEPHDDGDEGKSGETCKKSNVKVVKCQTSEVVAVDDDDDVSTGVVAMALPVESSSVMSPTEATSKVLQKPTYTPATNLSKSAVAERIMQIKFPGLSFVVYIVFWLIVDLIYSVF